MPLYTYKAKDTSGQAVSGTLEAAGESEAARSLREQGMWVTQLRPIASPRPAAVESDESFLDRVIGEAHPKDLALFYRQWASTVSAGISHARSADMVEPGLSGRLRRAFAGVRERLHRGLPLSEAMRPRRSLFGKVAVALLGAGETSGRLDAMLNHSADHYERKWKIRQKVQRAMVYPTLLLIAFILIPGIPVLVLEGPQAYVQTALLPALLMLVQLVLAFALFRVVMQVPVVSRVWDGALLLLPVLGKNIRKAAAARFARTFADLFEAGVRPREALEIAADTCGNRAIAERFLRAGPALDSGETLSAAFSRAGVFPVTAIGLLITGEESGYVVESMNKAAQYMESEVDGSTQGWLAALPVILWLIIAIPMIMRILGFWSSYAGNIQELSGP